MNTRSLVGSALCIVAPVIALACSAGVGDDVHAEDIGQATATITLVPTSVGCVDIQVASGVRTVDQRFTVTPGKPATLVLAGLPLGAVVFSGFAYATACASVTATTAATWATDPTAAVLAPGVAAGVELAFHAAGVADVGIGFDDAGIAPLLTFSSTYLKFNSVLCISGDTYQQSLVVTNQAAWPVTVTSASTSAQVWSSPATFTIPASSSITVSVVAEQVRDGIAEVNAMPTGWLTFTTNTAGDVPYPVKWDESVFGASFVFSPATIIAGQTTVLSNPGVAPGYFTIPGAIPASGTIPPLGSVSILFPTPGNPYPMTLSGACSTMSVQTLDVQPKGSIPPGAGGSGGGGSSSGGAQP